MRHPPPNSSLDSLKRELESRTVLPTSPLPEIRDKVTDLLPEFVDHFSAFNGKPEYGTFFGMNAMIERKSKDDKNSSPLPEPKKIKLDKVEKTAKDKKKSVNDSNLPAAKWNEIGKKYKNMAQECSSKEISDTDTLKLGAIYFLASTLSYLQGSVIREVF